MDELKRKMLEKQGYRIVGDHSAVKLCHWMRQSLYYNRPCYKQTFYGIESHRCVQMTPAVDWCSENCNFCWRARGGRVQGYRRRTTHLKYLRDQ